MSTPFNADHFIARAVQDSMAQATHHYWLRRAGEFERALPRAGDYFGRSTRETVAQQIARIQAKAQACRHRAEVCELTEDEQQVIFEFVRVALEQTRHQAAADREVAA